MYSTLGRNGYPDFEGLQLIHEPQNVAAVG